MIVGGIPRKSTGHSPAAQAAYDRARALIKALKIDRRSPGETQPQEAQQEHTE